ncbi:hypothetical protein CHS0354_018554 [Potamilus streckersoni]|uniref:Phosphatidylglycerol--prolipoprotein diacylglyceryl transferase n=1 Tax=Potamilus streckersoni TaxID=2493646 RepID=A0AAE0W9E4_9BIVA|nr:hypothetical protein CHS0354_018554 [Potamilus streckersoni]
MIWNVDPEIISFSFISLRYYGILFALTVLCGYYLFIWFCRKDNIEEINTDIYFTYVFFGIILGARLGHVLFYSPGYYLSNPIEIIKIWEGGLASHGGVIGIIFATWLYCYRHKVSFALTIDLLSISSMFCFFIRIGNFFNSEIIGKPTDVPWAIVFKRVDDLPRHPAQLYEAAGYLAILITLIVMYRVFKIKPGSYRLFGTNIMLTFILRLFVEIFKENQEHFEASLPINMGQILSIPFIIAGIYLVFIHKPAIQGVTLSAADQKTDRKNGGNRGKKHNR